MQPATVSTDSMVPRRGKPVSQEGILMLSTAVTELVLSPRRQSLNRLKVSVVAVAKSKGPTIMFTSPPVLVAILGTPFCLAVLAAPTVPERAAKAPIFWPLFVPLITISGERFCCPRAHETASPGDPEPFLGGLRLVLAIAVAG